MIINLTEKREHGFRGHVKPQKNVLHSVITTRPDEVKSKVGMTGQPITLVANYFRLNHSQWIIYQYRVDFEPAVDDIGLRRFLLRQLKERNLIGGNIFDGTMVFVERKFEEEKVSFTLTGRDETTSYRVDFSFASVISYTEPQSIQILNLILRVAMKGLNLQLVGRNLFDADAAVNNLLLYISMKL